MADNAVEERNKALLGRLLGETHEGNVDVVDEIAAEDIVTHGFFGMDATNREEYKQFYVNFGEAFGDQEFVVERLVAEGETVVVHFTISAVHRGEIMGIEPTGEELSWTGVAIDRFEDGRLVEAWLYPDYGAVFRQLGVLSADVTF